MSFTHLLGIAIIQDKKEKTNKDAKDDVEGSIDKTTRQQINQSRRSFFETLMCCGCFFSFGTTMAIIGPTLIELGHLVNHGLNMMSWLFFTQAAYALLGAVMAGIILDRFNCNRNLMLLVFLATNAVCLAIIPLCRDLWLLIMATAAAGYCVGVLDTATNVQLLSLHGKKVSPYLQALYFSYGFGAFVSPLIAEPFLSGEPHPKITAARREELMPYGGGKHRHHHLSHDNITKGIAMDGSVYNSEVQFAYWIIALAHVPVVIGLAYLVMLDMLESREQRKQENKTSEDSHNGDIRKSEVHGPVGLWGNPNRSQIICISLWTCLLVFLYDGMQGSYGGYIYTYAVKSSLKMKPAEGAFLTSMFWGSLALGRLISIPIALFTTPAVMLFADLGGTLTASLLMLIFKESVMVLWIGTSTFGLFMSNVFPSSVALVEQYFEVTGTITCMFVVSAAIGEMVIPLIVGKVFDYIGPISFLAEGCILCFAAFGVLLAVLITGKGLSNTSRGGAEEMPQEVWNPTEQNSTPLETTTEKTEIT